MDGIEQRGAIRLNKSGIFLASVSYSDLGSMYFRVVRTAQVDEIYRYLSRNQEIREAVVLWTCNRFEIYFYPGTHANLQYVKGYLEGKVSRYKITHGTGVIRHLFHVASGLDSMLVGENEIIGQTRSAWMQSRNCGLCGREMNRLFKGAVEAGKRVRTKTSIGKLRRSISREAVDMFEESDGSGPVLVVGAGVMGRQIATLLRKRGHSVSITNRTKERGARVAAELAVPLVDYGKDYWRNYRSCFFAVRSEEYLITAEDAPHLDGKVIVDVSVPFAVDPSLSDRCTLINLDTISERIRRVEDERKKLTEEAGLFIEIEIKNYMKRERSSGRDELIKKIFSISDTVVEEQMKHLSRQLSLGAAESGAVLNALEKERDRLLSIIVSSLKSDEGILSNADIERLRERLYRTEKKSLDLDDLR